MKNYTKLQNIIILSRVMVREHFTVAPWYRNHCMTSPQLRVGSILTILLGFP